MVKALLLKPLDGAPEGSERDLDKDDFERLKALGAVREAAVEKIGKAARPPMNKKAPAVPNKSGA